ncbi:MAG: FAD-dependent oxidoreductase [Acidobacteria bacterium]|nr:FAD-dependent oxidoreductase [Acidobacteriota bacterium]
MNNLGPPRCVVIVVGAGVAGLACALDLLVAGHSVTIAEQGPAPGGRARSFLWPRADVEVDTGPHLILGCYGSFRQMLKACGAELDLQPSMRVELRGRPGERVIVRGGRGRLANLWALTCTSRLPIADRLSILRGMYRIKRLRDTTHVEEWLALTRQSAGARRYFWEPLVLATLNRSSARAPSAQFLTVLAHAFLNRDADARMGRLGTPLSALYARPAIDTIRRLGGNVLLGDGVESFETAGNRIIAARTRRGLRLETDQVVTAVPPDALDRLIPDPSLTHFTPSPIVSAHVLLSRPLPFEEEGLLGLLDCPFQWAFQTRARDRWVASLLTSDARDLADLPVPRLAALARDALKSCCPTLHDHEIEAIFPVKERSATWSLTGPWRGLTAPPDNLTLAGDWTVADYPCTIESAALSGRRAARAVGQRLASEYG